ncbi:uncharacterized protein LOC120746519 [Simochromis diagramma]|uniref:uncharacterized protein LOC120746519 n=1 Tax=Simochromis diagramma TaxID=43689 RepID=UPI001A7EEE30|nr:uncharacterized protein LOC120746519 [Simochromis diagramma]
MFLSHSRGSQACIGQTTPLKNTRVNKLSRKTYRSGGDKTKTYVRPGTEYSACREPGPSGITQTKVNHTTPSHEVDHEDPLMLLEYLRDIQLPEQQQEKPQALCNRGDSEPFFITSPYIPPSECLPCDFSDVFEYSLSDFNIVDIPITPECLRNNSDSDIGFEEGCITDSQISQAYDAYLNAASTSTSEQSHSASKNDILSLIDARQNQQAVQRDLQEIAAKVNQQQEAAQGDLQEIAGALTGITQAIHNTWGLLDLISSRFSNR